MYTDKAMKLVAAALLGALLALGGCAGQSSSPQSSSAGSESLASTAVNDLSSSGEASSSASSASVEAEPAVLEIGEDSSDALTITFTNKIGAKISNFAVMPSYAEEDPAFLMADDQSWAKGDEAIVHFADAGDSTYDLYVQTESDLFVVHNLAIGGTDKVELREENGIVYATFELDGSTVSSLQDEAESAEDQGEEEYYEEEYYEEPAEYYEEPAQTEDSCIEGGVQLR